VGKITPVFDDNVNHRTPADYGSASNRPVSTHPVHAPAMRARYKELANAVVVPDDIAAPLERAKYKFTAAQDLLDFAIDDEGANGGAREALEIEADLRRDRPPEPAPLLSEMERMERARAVLDVASEMREMAQAQAAAQQPFTTSNNDKE
jgi:hypothetical protein